MEGDADISFPNNRMRMANLRDSAEDQNSNFVYWCPEIFPSDIAISWEFWPVQEPGLCMLFFAAEGRESQDLFAPQLEIRTGKYRQYHTGDINAFHIAYFRRRYPEERAFHICNLRKSYGAHLVSQGADPIPDSHDAENPYRMSLIKDNGKIAFYINELPVLKWEDDGKTYGPLLKQGRIGFRQMSPLIAEYSNLRVYSLKE